MARSVIFALAWAAIVLYLVNQVRRPSRWVGWPFLLYMNRSHSGVTDWGLRHIDVAADANILDIGCGGGGTIQKLATLAPAGKVYGIDYARGSVAAARAINSSLIDRGQVEIRHASVSRLPFANASFDLVTAVETQYYWPNIVSDMQEIQRVLRPGGTLLVIAETYNNGHLAILDRAAMKLLRARLLSVDEEKSVFAGAGYVNVEVRENRARGWMCACGRRPPT